MSVFCPILQRKVLYLDCQECESKECRTSQNSDNKRYSENSKAIRIGATEYVSAYESLMNY